MARQVKAKELGWEDAIQAVLRSEDGALHYAAIAEKIASQGLRSKVGANPAAVVVTTISRSLNDENTPFVRIGKGEYALKDSLREQSPSEASADAEADKSETGALSAFGMFWQRDLVVWSGKPKLLGRQSIGASEVNFSDQVGVYLLHDRERVIYVGRAADTMFSRLRAHTTDRLGGRWDRFSWFGLRSVGEDGALSAPHVAWTHEVVIETLEALLIESLEPPLNRKRGDNFSGAEYIQVADPEIEVMRKKQIVGDLLRAAGLAS